jgi:hypothetical protein
MGISSGKFQVAKIQILFLITKPANTFLRIIYDYDDIKGDAHEIKAKNINPYLVDAKDIFIEKKRQPISNVPKIIYGNMPNDGGNFLFTDDEKNDFIKREPKAEKFIFPLISAHEFLNGEKRWCLWLKNANPTEIKELKLVTERIENVRKVRLASSREATRELANFSTLFGFISQPESDYILIPRHSSENRKYIPMGFFDKNSIVADSCLAVPNATLYHFGVLHSFMHMAWVKTVCGRLESRFRYSNEIVYNNFPFPENSTEKQIQAVEKAAQKVLDVRANFQNSSLADLYHPLTMPPELVKAHKDLDKAVDACYCPATRGLNPLFKTETERMEFLFEMYEAAVAGLFGEGKKGK